MLSLGKINPTFSCLTTYLLRFSLQAFGFPMGTTCTPLLADLFLSSNENDVLQELFMKKEKKLAVAFNLTFRYIDDVLSQNDWNLLNGYIPYILEITDTTDVVKSASYLD